MRLLLILMLASGQTRAMCSRALPARHQRIPGDGNRSLLFSRFGPQTHTIA